jgi:hypothetical protein
LKLKDLHKSASLRSTCTREKSPSYPLYRGKSRPRWTRNAYQFVRDLVAKAVRQRTRILGLFVEWDKKRAIRFHERAGLNAFRAGRKNDLRMYLYLREPAAPSRRITRGRRPPRVGKSDLPDKVEMSVLGPSGHFLAKV